MLKFIVVKKGSIIFILLSIMILTLGAVWSLSSKNTYPTISLSEKASDKQTVHLVIGEYKSKTVDGNELEVYRWDPGTIFVEKGKELELRILGINGAEHPFYIEGTSVKGIVKKGEETVVNVTFSKEGTYRLICEAHKILENNGPMIGYIIVD
ncbi:cupredoxin domain-containing protein [Rossellomorea aquimaris]|uniref:cupredoxin domain-containing protein n=1 Tax=Rossellomorea aquimaris TaxID=189382 RepID=UPI000A46A216|nr:cupredoxin domain-containing protein [Rossellomorea aquimaris]